MNPLPVDCPLLLMDLGEVNSDLDSVIQEARGAGSMRHGVVSNEIRMHGEASATSSTSHRSRSVTFIEGTEILPNSGED